jgi:trehalose 6-phosphate synthase
VSRLIVVSNRAPSASAKSSCGGLAVALKAVLAERGGLWFGWSGDTSAATGFRRNPGPDIGFRLLTTDLTEEELEGYYIQCANRALWPLFHNRVDLACFDYDHHETYNRVNERFAAGVEAELQAGDIVWVHDYHLFPLGAALRRRGVSRPLGFFLHIPFPPPDAFEALPWHRELLEDLCAYDLLGFQTTQCMHNFRAALERFSDRNAGAAVGHPQLSVVGRAKAAAYPVGIDTKAFAALAASPVVRRLTADLAARHRGSAWIAGVDRLDYTKGLPERFLAMETLLEHRPEFLGRISLVQVAAPSREGVVEYQKAQESLETLSGRINARFSTFDWSPIRLLNRSFDHREVAALYRVSRVGLVTPLRDGMNMVAKEYVAAQDPEDPGVLVLSRFAGAAAELTEALLVNPHDRVEVADAIYAAAIMPLAERRARWEAMMQHLNRHDVHRWCRRFLADLAGPAVGQPAVAA